MGKIPVKTRMGGLFLEEIWISGGTAHIPVMKEAAKQIMSANPEISISIAGVALDGVSPTIRYGQIR